MKLLRDIIYKAGIAAIQGSTQVAISHVTSDSREVKKFGLFVAVKGTQTDGHTHIDKAIAAGAVAVICELLPETLLPEVTYVQVQNSGLALGIVAANFYDHPSHRLKLVGVTGTNGKTTIATTLYTLFTQLGYKTGLLSTVENRIGQEVMTATHTTPNAVQLQALLHEMVSQKVAYCFMEVSSHALHQHRVAGTKFRGAIFSNLTHDHLDYHGTFTEYMKAKKMLFDGLGEDAFALVNADDRQAAFMLQNCKGVKKTYGLKTLADFKGKITENDMGGLLMDMDGTEVSTHFSGAFNGSNLLAVYGAACLLGQERMHVLTTLSTLHPVRGRFQKIHLGKGPVGIVDYAHTPDALENVLKTLREVLVTGQRLFTLVGCGGNRDTAKRPIMAKTAAQWSDQVILTSDNPRFEEPAVILKEMEKGLLPEHFQKTLTIQDRAEAIRTAVRLASPKDVILIAGKGHETYQEIQGVKHPFDDAEHFTESIKLQYPNLS
jgi:UDP-N-acetylmuramoyl-L-alanyl-D-glutamate--2,6-diaminopimelate ligase